MKAILIPGNGGGTPQDNWFPYLERELPKLGIAVINTQFPDPELARKEFWLPFIAGLGADEETILIGHSTGAVAALRYAQEHKILGSVLVGASYTDLGYESEREGQYFDDPWDWQTIQNNQRWIIEFASTDDPFIPIEESRFIHESLATYYHEYTEKGHFGHGDTPLLEFPELVEAIAGKL
ncbi:MAG: alpha/beta fold hydrolase [Patescibacteria group bacterium]